MVRCTIWYHLYNLKNVKNNHGGVLILVKLQTSACNFTKINTPPWVFFTFLKLYKWYQIAQRITYNPSILWMLVAPFYNFFMSEKSDCSLRSVSVRSYELLRFCTTFYKSYLFQILLAEFLDESYETFW